MSTTNSKNTETTTVTNNNSTKEAKVQKIEKTEGFVHIKSIPVKCIGIDGNGKQFAEGHTAMRLVGKADVHQVKRCVACQKAYLKIGSKIRRAKKSKKNAQNRLNEAAKNAKTIMNNKEVFGSLSKEDQEYIKNLSKSIVS